MRADFPDKDAIPQEMRLLMRSRHIYILFSALIHLALGVYLQIRPQIWRKLLQFGGSGAIAISSAVLLWAWYAETNTFRHFSDISRFGIYLSLTGIGLHLIGGVGRNSERP